MQGYLSRPSTCTSVSSSYGPEGAAALTKRLPLDSKQGILILSPSQNEKQSELLEYYCALYRAWGPQHWWPAQTRFEVIVGAYLTQNTAWTNVELALANLHRADILSVEGIRKVSLDKLQILIRPSGYFRQKAARLKTFVAFLDEKYGGLLDQLFAQPTRQIRRSGAERPSERLIAARQHAAVEGNSAGRDRQHRVPAS